MIRIRTAAVLTVAMIPALATAQNLLTNRHFDTGLKSWAASSGVIWDSARNNGSGGSTGSGSAFVTTTGTDSETLVQCVPVLPDTAYGFGVWALRLDSQRCPGDTHYMAIRWMLDAGCDLPLPRADLTPFASVEGVWESLAAQAVSPPDAQAASVEIVARCEAGGTTAAYFDDAFIGSAPTTVTLESFVIE